MRKEDEDLPVASPLWVPCPGCEGYISGGTEVREEAA